MKSGGSCTLSLMMGGGHSYPPEQVCPSTSLSPDRRDGRISVRASPTGINAFPYADGQVACGLDVVWLRAYRPAHGAVQGDSSTRAEDPFACPRTTPLGPPKGLPVS